AWHEPAQRRDHRVGQLVDEAADRLVEGRAGRDQDHAHEEQRDKETERGADQEYRGIGQIVHRPESRSSNWAGISRPRRGAAATALATISLNRSAAKLSSAACVVPFGEVTRRRRSAGEAPASVSMRPAPRQVCAASARAAARGIPWATAASS